MAHHLSTAVTAVATKALHAGLNTVVAGYTLAETASSSSTIDMLKLPGGARVVDLQVAAGDIGTGAETVYVADTEGNEYFSTATAAYDATFRRSNSTGFGERLTGSAHVRLTIGGAVDTGTSQTVFTVICSYLAEDDPD